MYNRESNYSWNWLGPTATSGFNIKLAYCPSAQELQKLSG